MNRQCDFNIHAYDFDNLHTQAKYRHDVSQKPKGKIQGGVANSVCVAHIRFAHTSFIQGPLKDSTIYNNLSSLKTQELNSAVCNNWQWNTCYGCQTFTRAKCRNINLDSSNYGSFRRAARIQGGNDAVPGQHPYQIRISKELDGRVNPTVCGGVIYNSKYVITSAYCVYKVIPCMLTVFAGDYSVSQKEDTEQIRRVVSIISHEKYAHRNSRHNDIALLKLDSPLNFTTHVQPVLLATLEYPTINVKAVELSGWGDVSLSYDAPDVLQAVMIPFIDECDCRLEYSYLTGNSITANKICAGSFGKGICNQDEGNPLIVQDNGTKYLVGIASYALGCGHHAGVATKVLAYRDWIHLRAGEGVKI